MRKRTSSHPARRGLLVVALLAVAAIGGYAAAAYWRERPPAEHDVATHTPSENETSQPDTAACIAGLPTEMKLRQKLMFAVYSDQIDQLVPIIAPLDIGGVIVMDEASQEQIATLTNAFKVPPFVAVDQEGGTVQRYKSHGVVPGASTVAQLSTDEAYRIYLQDSRFLASVGLTTNFAPIVDVESRAISPLPGRLFSSDPTVVASYAKEAIRAMRDASIQPVIKHFPGLGSATGNTDFVEATTDPFSVMKDRDILPYKDLAGLKPDVMIGNMIVPELTNNQPAIWSPEVVALLRSLGYDEAVVYTDSLTAEAVPGNLEDAAGKAWTAGIDVALIVQSREQAGDIPSLVSLILSAAINNFQADATNEDELNKSVARILARKQLNPCQLQE